MAGANVILVLAGNWDGILHRWTPVFAFVCLANIRASLLVRIDPFETCFRRRAPKEGNCDDDKDALHLKNEFKRS